MQAVCRSLRPGAGSLQSLCVVAAGSCSTDELTFYSLDGGAGDDENPRLMSRLCGDKIPGPLMVASHRLRVVFRSDDAPNKRYDSGFKARYEWLHPAAKRPSE